MKTLRLFLLFIALIMGANAMPTGINMEIKDGWKFRQARLNNWYDAEVPGVVHTDLIRNEIIEDPFFRLNERGVQWVDKEDWIYETSFNISNDILSNENIRLHFYGLDTYADVYLNDSLVLKADNMFRQWFADAKALLNEGQNKLRVYFHSPVKIDVPKWDALPYQYEAGNDQSENGGLMNKKISVFARKAGYHYGWDWGPRLVTSGIWRPVVLEAWNDVHIEDVFIIQPEVNARKAQLSGQIELNASRPMKSVSIRITDMKSGKVIATQTRDIDQGRSKAVIDFTIRNPKLWWSNGLGEPHLYTFRTDVLEGNTILASHETRTGIRSVKVVNEPDKAGKTFYVELNGVPVFMKGANYIPQDNFLPRVTDEKYKETILAAVNANMNMLRIWGGGIYENDVFYNLCDEYGILVWQDFMFACSIYPAEGELLENIRLEAIDNVKRLRNHPSIALWCGNNECNDAWFNWGWKRNYTRQNPAYAERIWKQLTDQYYVTLPAVVNEYVPGMFYWPSSPFAHYESGSDGINGDSHYWSVWHGKEPISKYNEVKSRFFSEYGFQSFPEFESVKLYAPQARDWDITSEVMMSHQRGGAHANNLIKTYLLNEYKEPKDFQTFLYMNLLLQGDAIKTAIEAHRRDMPYCMGTLFWQHNDCWPVASWSSRDYYGRWKAQHYFARKAFKDILVSPIAKENKLDVFVVSDRLKDTRGTLVVEARALNGEIINTYSKNINIKANTSNTLFNTSMDLFAKDNRLEEMFIYSRLTLNDGTVYDNCYFPIKQKDVIYPKSVIQHTVKSVSSGEYIVELSTDNFARAVFLSLNGIDNFFSDNYFDLIPGQKKTIEVKSNLSEDEFRKQLHIVCLNDFY